MITGVILAHNEEHLIVDCIAALRPHVDELILIDTQSTDQTVTIAQSRVDRVLSHPQVPDFDAVRNIAIPEARFEWLWFVDADQRIPQATGKLVNDLIRTSGHEFDAISIPLKSHFCGQWIRHCGPLPGYAGCRVLKRGHFAFGRTLHSELTFRGREIRFPPDPELVVPHLSLRDFEHYVSRFNRNTNDEALQLNERNTQYDWRLAIQMMMHDLWEHYELNHAALDGSLGWILTWMAGQYRWMSYAKLVAFQPVDSQPSVPMGLDELLSVMQQELAVFRTSKPQLPLGVVLRQTVSSEGENLAAILSCARALTDGERLLAIDSGSPENTFDSALPDRRLLRSLCRTQRPPYSIGIDFDSPSIAIPSRFDVINILWMSWPEAAENIPADWIDRAKRFDEVWVGSVHECTALRRRWVAPERIRLLNLGGSGSDSNRQAIEQAINELELRLQPPAATDNRGSRIQVEFEGEILAGHSFSNVNEQTLLELERDPSITVALHRVFNNPTADRLAPRADKLLGLANRRLTGQPDLTIRHTFPPNWTPPKSGLWVHIQPWEYGPVPLDWLPPLRDEVHEIWAPSNYVKRVFVQSGVSPNKIQVIPYGFDESTFIPDSPPIILPTQKSFRFLFVGGTILRKGFDRVLEAYLAEFGPDEDVCLIVKDTGVRSFYAKANLRQQVLAAIADANNPQIIYIDEDFTAGQLASLYCSCQCLVAPYRGEGFGLPVLEAMACGIAPIVPRGGPTDDFVSDDSAYLLAAQEIQNDMKGLCGPGTEFDISLNDLRSALRIAMTDRDRTRALGARASTSIRDRFNWASAVKLMVARIHLLTHGCQ